MRDSKNAIQSFLIDTNVFIAAIKKPRKERKTLQLILRMAEREDIRVVGNEHLVKEMWRYAEEYGSETAIQLVGKLLEKMVFIRVGKNYLRICKDYIKSPNKADILRAATCLKSDAVLITNDKHFDKIRDEGIVKVGTISEAVRRIL